MNNLDKARFRDRYGARYAAHGYSPATLGWGKVGRQQVRFGVLAGIGIDPDDSVLDVGCGFGDLHAFLREREWRGRYVGLDIVDVLLKEGRKRHPDARLENHDLLESEAPASPHAFALASGTFNAKLHAADNYEHTFMMLRRMFESVTKGVAADFLSSYVDFRQEDAFHAEPEKILAFAKTLSRRVALRHDYMPYEFCIYIYKDDSINEQNVFNAQNQEANSFR